MLMKRSLLIAALSTVAAGSALAQSSVTVYGRLNESVERQKTNDDTQTVLQNNASRIGFRGVEDLGGGLKAGFTLEHRLNADTGAATNNGLNNTTNAFWGGAGESSVFLSSNFGQVKLGHFTSEAYFATSDMTDLLNHGTGTSSDALYKYLNNDNNKVSYRTPTFAGATVELAVLLGEGAAATPKKAYDLAVNYNIGNLGVGLGYERSPFDDTQAAVRVSYSMSPFTVTGYVQRFNNDSIDESKTIARVSGQYDIGALELHAAVGLAGEIDGAGSGPLAEDEGKARQYTFGVNYNLSKRTKVFAFYNRTKQDAVDANATNTFSAASLGVRHNF
jgi:predicted porin